MARIAIGEFGDKKIIPDLQGGDHGTGWDIEGLKCDGTNANRNRGGIDNRFDAFQPTAGFLRGHVNSKDNAQMA